MPLQPLDNRVVLKRIAAEQKVGSIVVVKNSAEKPRGKVVAVGDGRLTSAGTFVPIGVTGGETVFFDEGAVQAVVKEGEEELLVVNADGLLAVIEPA